MVGIGETYIPAFALAIGLGEVLSGLIVSVPMLIGGLAQLISLRAISWCGSYRAWIVGCSAVQAMAFLPLIWAAIQGNASPAWMFAVVSCYWGVGLAAGPAWNSWIAHVVPPQIRPRFFAKRTRLIQLATFSGFLLGGGILFVSGKLENVLLGFALLFGIAAIARAISVAYLAMHRVNEREYPFKQAAHLSIAENTEESKRLGVRLIVYLASMQAFVQFSGPFFVPYMLKELALSYQQFVLLVGVAFVSKALSMPMWGSLAKRRGGKYILAVGGVAVIPLASLWTISDSVAWLCLVQAISGVTWAAYELGFFLVFLNDVSQKHRARLMTIYNLANAMAWFTGAMLGGWFLASGGATHSTYHGLFVISTAGRAACLFFLWNFYRSPSHPPIYSEADNPQLTTAARNAVGSTSTAPATAPILAQQSSEQAA